MLQAEDAFLANLEGFGSCSPTSTSRFSLRELWLILTPVPIALLCNVLC